ncbi:unnamed protein product [Didymodactylos carnosus]|uniref:Dynein-1, subspecies f n=1 Tax=Didymodactylos carnosus TaxID=1234261 RepID=A0A813WMH7_9BILA|nr:unnamed protein product [Didymodactylos carnosus]CAF0853351.1 unnamed protein product [Didymodactylos carnosus]CAF3501108.1 unnamed protein product [Didymodactylos carnosus]CAF3641061.1 unnamed protein product [Didymodactylos carnosus]
MLELHRTLPRMWSNYKLILEESTTSFKRVKEEMKVLLQKEQEKCQNQIIELQKFLKIKGPHGAEIAVHTALSEIESIENQIAGIENDEKRLKIAYRIFNLDMPVSKELQNIKKDIEILKSIWLMAKEYELLATWKTKEFKELRIDELDDFAQSYYKKLFKMSRDYKDKEWEILDSLRDQIHTLRRTMPLISSLHNPHMRPRHWNQIKLETEKSFNEESKEFTLEKILDLHFEENIQILTEISENATKEYSIERILEKIVDIWENLKFDTILHKANVYRLKAPDDIIQFVEEHTAQISTMKGTRHVKPFQTEVNYWEKSIAQVSELIDGLLDVQRQWLYMEGIFTSEDVQRQLPREAAEFKYIDTTWQDIINKIRENPKALRITTTLNLFDKIQDLLKLLDKIQKKMEDYLETKRRIFPRFYFISNEELVEILGLSRQPDLIQPQLKKLFEGIKTLRSLMKKTFIANGMISHEGEEVNLIASISLDGNVELWLKDLEIKMQLSIREYLKNTLAALRQNLGKREKWVRDWPSQCCVTASKIEWTSATTKALHTAKADGSTKPLKRLFRTQLKILDKYSTMVRLQLNNVLRLRIVSLITKEVHGRDIIEKLIKSNTIDSQAFEYQMQLRFYWERYESQEECIIRQTITKFRYNYEYLGCTSRLVVSPLTDRCFITLTTALHLFRGGSPKGPAGTGKTETIKDLGKDFAIYVVVQNCSDAMDYKSMGKIFSGLAQSGSWGCFDEFNRINIEVLSVVAQQILSILTALASKQKQFLFEGNEISLLSQVGIFITMNPGYTGRTELPDNLTSMFRPISMVIPDSIYIAEIFLFSEGFQKTRNLARKVYTLYQLSAQQLSKQDHYDFGLRSLTAVLRYAGGKKRANVKLTDDEVLLLAMFDMNAPKMTAQDLPLFKGIVEDLFPDIEQPKVDYTNLIEAIEEEMSNHNLQITSITVQKVIELYETRNSRHSIMLVGKTLSGKTTTWKLLKYSCILLNKRGIIEFNKITEYPINPKAVTLGELYGEFNLATSEWNDGILSTIMRQVCADEKPDEKWILFDSPVDTSWIESMNSLMDDNKLLTLANGERISMPSQVVLLFETEDLSITSPATVSRAGIVYCDYEQLGWKPYLESWIVRKQGDLQSELRDFLTKYLDIIMKSKRQNCQELVSIHELNGIISFTKLFDTFYFSEEVQSLLENDIISRITEMWMVFCLLWSIAASVDDIGRKKIDIIFREIEGTFPNKDTVFEFYVDMRNRTWIHWEETLKNGWIYDGTLPFYKIIVPTVDTARYEFIIRSLVLAKHPMLLVGAVGTGKTTVCENVLNKLDLEQYNLLIVHMSAQTTSKMLQDIFESNLEKRAKNIFVPLNGRKMVSFIDDLNMSGKDLYGSYPPLELIRTWIDYEFWYDRKTQGMKYIKDLFLLTTMGPPDGGRQQLPRRFQSRFNLINMTFPMDQEIHRIFGTMLNQKFVDFEDEVKYMDSIITKATVSLYQTVEKKYLPTPTKLHYTFNMRDISRMFEGLLLCSKQLITTKIQILRLWIHEAHRVYSDRFITVKDNEQFVQIILQEKLAHYFDQVYHNVCPNREQPLFTDILRTDNLYDDIKDQNKLKNFLIKTLEEYNQTPLIISMDLVMFKDAISHIIRLIRVFRRPRGNMLILGVGGSGRQSLTRLAAFICEIIVFQIEIGRKYGHMEFKEDLRRLMKLCGINNRETVFLFVDTQIVDSIFLEDINALLHSGEVPNLFRNEDIQEIRSNLQGVMLRQGISDTNLNVIKFFLERVKSNLHIVICMSPFGETFRNYIRMYPALVNCTTIDYFSEWPYEALIEVSHRYLAKFKFAENNENIHRYLADLCAIIHTTTKVLAQRMKDELRREVYVTPTNYLQFVSNYGIIFELERSKILFEYNRLQAGIAKVAETREKVAEISLELEKKKILVANLQKECEAFLLKIVEQKNSASERERQVQAFGHRIADEEIRCQTTAQAAQEELSEAEPLLAKANEALQKLTKKEIGEVKAYVRPPAAVASVMRGLMILKGKEDSWEEARRDIADVNFIGKLLTFKADEISDRTLRKIQPFINDPEMTIEKVKSISGAAGALCNWIRAVESYARIYRIVQPKKERYQKAASELQEKQYLLQESKDELAGIQKKIEELRIEYEIKIKEKNELQRNAEETAMFLDRATKLLDGVTEKRATWDITCATLLENQLDLVGNCLLACAFLSYMGLFLSDYRDDIMQNVWIKELERRGIRYKKDYNFSQFMITPTQIREWNIQGLPRDNFSTENAILTTRSWSQPLFIDPQSQATKWIKRMEKLNGLKITDLQTRDYMKIIEECVKTGNPCLCQNILEDLPETLNPILNKKVRKVGDHYVLTLGDREINYNSQFRFYMATRLSNPHYKPEIYSKVNIINFAIKEQGLQEQLLGIVVRKEKPELEAQKDKCIVTMASKRKEKEQLEQEFLRLLSETKGSLLENVKVFESLDLSKQSQKDIEDTLKINEETEAKIDITREQYRSVAQRASILFFILNDLGHIDPMYQFSLEAYVQLFILSIEKSPRSLKLNERIEKLNDYHTYAVYRYGCRGLFERHKLLFSFHMCTKIMDVDGRLNHDEYNFFLRASALVIDRDTQFSNPFPQWLSETKWDQMSELIRMPDYRFLRDAFDQFPKDWKEWYRSERAEETSLPGTIDSLINEFGKMLIIRCLRPDRVAICVFNFVTHNIGSKFVEPPILQLTSILEDSDKRSPLIFVLSPGVDPSNKLQQLVEERKMTSRFFSLSLGQGQALVARKLLEQGMKKGHWVYLANCHLSISWLPELDKIVEQLQTAAVHNEFRLWLSSSPTPNFPISILQTGLKITNEPPKRWVFDDDDDDDDSKCRLSFHIPSIRFKRVLGHKNRIFGIKANMKRLYETITLEQFQRCRKGEQYRKLLFTLTFLHSIIIERKKFLQLGWNVNYSFNDSDFQISENLLQIYLDDYEKTPFEALKYLIAIVIYGGHCTDEWDMRLLQIYIDSYIREDMLETTYYKLSSLPYYYVPSDGSLKIYKNFINSMPWTDHPEAFGQHSNADVASQIQESKILFDTLLAVLPQKTSAAAEKEVEDEVRKAAADMLKSMPHEINIEAVTNYIIEGLVVMSSDLDEIFKCIYEGRLPATWQKTYFSMKPLGAWFQDLRQRMEFFNSWVEHARLPQVYWISAFSYPTAFLTAVLQRTSRKDQIAVDLLSWEFEVMKQTDDKYLPEIEEGIYVTGLYLEGAGWDKKMGTLTEAQSMQLVTKMPTIHFKPVEHKKKSIRGLYTCPCYYNPARAGSFILAVELKSGPMPAEHWIKCATALLMNLDL